MRVENFTASLDATPFPVTYQKLALAITGDDVRSIVYNEVIDDLLVNTPALAQLLADAMAGNFTRLLQKLYVPNTRDACTVDYSTASSYESALFAVACGDAEDHPGIDIPYLVEYVKKMKQRSITAGAVHAKSRITCHGWKTRAKWRFDGPLTTPPADPSPKGGIPAAPLLFLSSRLDLITLLYGAYLASAGHPVSLVVVQDSVGYSALYTG